MSEAVETVVENTIVAMRGAIRDGRYAQGQRLVVAEVTKSLGVSAGPVREAIRRLAGEGLIEITPYRGASVVALKGKDIREIFQIREVLEGLAARQAAEHIGAGENRSELQASVATMREIVRQDSPDYIAHNQSFHELIYRLSGNGRLRDQAIQMTVPIYQLRLHQLIGRGYRRTSASEHELIAEAILEADGALAERAMRNHIRNSGLAMIDAMERNAASPQRSRLLSE